MNDNSALIELLNRCIVLIDADDQIGTGFFVAPGTILTCAHVIENAVPTGNPIHVIYGGTKYEVRAVRTEEVFSDDNEDLALLHIKLKGHPCVLLSADNFSVTSSLHSYGFSITQEGQKIVGEEIKTILEGRRDELQPDLTLEQVYIKFKDGQIKPGNSGAPLLDMDAWTVTGVVNRTRGKETALGGFAIPMKTVFSLYPRLQKLNEKYHKSEPVWMQLAQGIKARKPSNPISAELINEPRKSAPAENFVERDVLLKRIEQLLEKETARVNVNGMAGIGKTTLAREIVDRRLRERQGTVLWVDVGSAVPEEVIEEIAEDAYKNPKLLGDARDFESEKEMLRKFWEGELENEKDELKKDRINLVVLDNVVEGSIWLALSDAFPKKLPVLITSRTRFAARDFVDVGQLSPDQALYMLGKTVGDKDFSKDKDAAFLCQLFGYHPLALEILGANMKEACLNPKKQRERLEKDPTRLESELHEDRLWVLLENSVAELNDIERAVFETFGEFLVNGLSLNLLTTYLRKPSEDVQEALDRLGKRNLVKNRHDTDFYYLHDVIFHYAKSLAKPIERNKSRLVSVALSYLKKYRREYDLIKVDLANLLAIAKISKGVKLVQIMSYLTIGNFPLQEGKSFADQRGYSLGLIEQLDRAVETARDMGDELKFTTHYLLGKRGNAAFRRGEYELAVDAFIRALSFSPNEERKIMLGAALARSLAFCGRLNESQTQFEISGRLANELNDDWLQGFVLEQESHAAGHLRDFGRALHVAERQLTLAESVSDKTNSVEYEPLCYALLNLGTAKLDLAKEGQGRTDGVLNLYTRAKNIAEERRDNRVLALAHESLGQYFHQVEDRLQAQTNFDKALKLWHEIGMTQEEKILKTIMQELNYQILPLKEDSDE